MLSKEELKKLDEEQLKEELEALRKKGIETKEDNSRENYLMEAIAQKQIADGTYNYDYKYDLQCCVDTIECVLTDYKRCIAEGQYDEIHMEKLKDGKRLWTEVLEKYQKVLDSDLTYEEYKKASENFYQDEERVLDYLDEKYLGK